MNLDVTNLDLDSLTDKQLDELNRLISEVEDMHLPDFDDWCHKYLPRKFPVKSAEFWGDIVEDLNRFEKGKRIAVAAPRGHSKTTTLSIGYPLYSICEGIHRFILIFSASNASNIMKSITNEVEMNEQLIADYPFLKPAKDKKKQNEGWNDKDLCFASGQRISVRGMGTEPRGFYHREYRPDLLLFDDSEARDSVSSDYLREKFEDDITQIHFNLGDHNGFDVLFLGTILHPESFLSKLLAPDKFTRFKKYFYQAVLDWHKEEVLWPEVMSFELLMEKMADIGERAFYQEYQQIPSKVFDTVFKQEIFQYFPNSFLGDNKYKMAGWRRFAYVDPAMGKTHGDYTCVAVGMQNFKGVTHLVEWLTVKPNASELGILLERLNEQYDISEVGFEVNATQGVFIELYKGQGSKINFIPVMNSLPKKNRIDGLEIPIRKGEILFDPEWEKRTDSYPDSMRQALWYSGKDNKEKDDALDALAGLYSMSLKYVNKQPLSADYRR